MKKRWIAIVLILSLISAASIFLINRSKKTDSTNQLISINIQNKYLPQTPSLETIFDNNHHWIATLSAEKITTLLATGDVIPARSVNYQTVKRNNFKWSFEKTADFLKNADLTIINLESPLIENCPLTNEGMIFCGDPRHIEGFVFAGVDVANLANNHSQNYGEKGLEETFALLKNANITTVGINDPVFKEVKKQKIAFLGYNALNNIDRSLLSIQINQARKNADLVVVMFHWGIEYTDQPSLEQKELAYLAIDSGADLILGNHPHWIQPIEIYNKKLIVYAQGNFIFDQMWSEKTKEGFVGRYVFYENQLIDIEFFPIYIENYGQPNFLEGKGKLQILDSLRKANADLPNNKD